MRFPVSLALMSPTIVVSHNRATFVVLFSFRIIFTKYEGRSGSWRTTRHSRATYRFTRLSIDAVTDSHMSLHLKKYVSTHLFEQVLGRYYLRIAVRTRKRHLVVSRQFSHTQILRTIVETSAMQIARVRTPNRLNLVVYVQHSRGIISSDADLCTKRPGFLSRLLLNPGVCAF